MRRCSSALPAALGAAISMGLSEGLSDDGSSPAAARRCTRGLITGGATFIGGTMHSLPFLIHDARRALTVAYVVVACELLAIAFVRKRFLHVSLPQSLIQVDARRRAGRRRRRGHRPGVTSGVRPRCHPSTPPPSEARTRVAYSVPSSRTTFNDHVPALSGFVARLKM